MIDDVVAVDWSGERSGGRRKIWVAEVHEGVLTRLTTGRSREEVCGALVEIGRRRPDAAVGLDFAFSTPAWFLDVHGIADGTGLWARAESEPEEWLAPPVPPFWGRPGSRRPSGTVEFRRTEDEIRRHGAHPKSVFQVGGAGSVGTGSVRGWPTLHRLSRAGFSVWPFRPARPPIAVEIYPRLLSGPVVKSDPRERARYLAERVPGMAPLHRRQAVESEDAFDAAVSAMAMWRGRGDLASLPTVSDPQLLKEGWVWGS